LSGKYDNIVKFAIEAKSIGITNGMLKILQLFDTIVAEIQFLQTFECIEIFDFSDAVRLQRKDLKASQTVEILRVIQLIKVTVISETPTSSFVILFLPSQSSSRLTSASRFSICLVRCISGGAHDEEVIRSSP
jgi:hypothetical protein